ncbi:MAG: polyprenyl synthetase family protein [Deltaproteobacteria bacterium]|nr:polyprenyl synthetase family protein [Candidatus Zymogenaceae bacterium]
MTETFSVIEDDLKALESELADNLASDVTLIPKIGRHLFSSGGKRFRPSLLILCARLFHGDRHQYLPLAGVIELIHAATLLHDDVVDKADMRRGVQSVNRLWGNEASILVGDFLISQAFSIMVDSGSLRILQIVSETTKKMSEGEMFQISLGDRIDISEQEYLKVIYNKTAILISAACRIGTILGDATEEDEERIVRFGEGLGMAFQIVDDVLDYVSRSSDLGKPVGIDFTERKPTLPLIYALSRMNDEERAYVTGLFYANTLSDDEFREIARLVRKNGGIDFSLKRAAHYVDDAKKELSYLMDSEEKQALIGIADYIIERSA